MGELRSIGGVRGVRRTIWSSRHGFHVTAAQWSAGHLQLALHDGRVGNDLRPAIEEHVDSAQRMVPVVVFERLFRVVPEGQIHELADRSQLDGAQFAGAELS